MSSGKGHCESHNSQQRLEHLNAVLRAIRSVNQLIVHEKDPDALVQQACNLLVETRGYYSAWMTLLDGEGNLRTATESGLGDAFQPMAERLQHGEFPARVRRALAEPGVHVIRSPALECADCPLSHSYEGRAGMAVRLEHGGETYGLMIVSVPVEHARDDEEAELLQEVAADIAFAMHSITVGDERREAEEALHHAEETLMASLEHAPEAIYMTDLKGVLLYGNRKAEEIVGYKKEELIGKSFQELGLLPAGYLAEAAKLLALSVMGKPTGPDEIELLRKDGSGVWVEANTAHITQRGVEVVIGFARDITERRRVQEQLEASYGRLEHMLQGMIHVIERITETRDAYTAGHQRKVAELSTAIARQMGLPEETCVSVIEMAARVHDIGKTAVPAEILAKPGKLNDAELTLIKIHPQVGYGILKSAGLPYPVAETVLQHHERLDGSGYPRGLSGDDILPEAQILAVADVVEAMSSHRPYRAALGIEAALEEVSNGSGTQYYPDVVEACLAVFRQNGFAFSS